MNTKRLQELAGIQINEVSDADMKKLRRVVILSIFNSDIPVQIERDLNAAISSAPDSDVRKVTKVFLDQVVKDKETLNASSEYQKLKQDPEFQKLSQIIVSILNKDNKAGLLDMSNIGFTTSDIVKPFSYSILLYHAVEPEAAKLLNYLQTKYGDNFKKVLAKMLPSQSRPAVRPTKENLDELGQDDLVDMIKPGYLPSKKFDEDYSTHLSKEYKLPLDVNIIQKTLDQAIKSHNLFTDDTYSSEIDKIYTPLIQLNPELKVNVKNTEDKWNVIYGVTSQLNPDDIKYFVENQPNRFKDETEKTLPVEKAYEKYEVAIDWIPSPKSWEIIKNTLTTKFPDVQWPLDNITEDVKNFFKLIM